MLRMRLWPFAMLAVLLANTANAERLYPRDEARQDRSFLAFRRQLMTAVRKKDREYLLRVLDPKILVNFGGGQGIGAFQEEWNLKSPGTPIWDTLADVLTHGGEFYQEGSVRGFAAPYTSSAFPDELDAFEYLCVIGANIPLRSQPDERAPIVTRLSYDLVRLANPAAGFGPTEKPWVQVTTDSGRRGYLPRRWVRSPIGYRATFEKRGGRWQMTTFVAGD